MPQVSRLWKKHAAGLGQVIHFIWKQGLGFITIHHVNAITGSHTMLTQAFGSYIVDIKLYIHWSFGCFYICNQAPEMQGRDTWQLVQFKMKQSERERVTHKTGEKNRGTRCSLMFIIAYIININQTTQSMTHLGRFQVN